MTGINHCLTTRPCLSDPATNGPAGELLPAALDARYPDEEPWEEIHRRVDALATAVVRADDPGEAGAYAVAELRHVLEYRFEVLFSCFCLPDMDGSREAARRALLDDLWQGADPA